jgi:hypothetical protein
MCASDGSNDGGSGGLPPFANQHLVGRVVVVDVALAGLCRKRPKHFTSSTVIRCSSNCSARGTDRRTPRRGEQSIIIGGVISATNADPTCLPKGLP